MALPTYFLGGYDFHQMWGTPDLPQSEIVGEARPGVDNHSLWNLATRGKPFQITTERGAVNYAAGLALWYTYPPATAMNPLELTIADVTIPGGKFKVLGVSGEVKSVLRYNRAGIATLYQAIVRAVWTLLPIDNP